MFARTRSPECWVPTAGGDFRRDDTILSVAEVARWVGRSVGTIYEWYLKGIVGRRGRVRLHMQLSPGKTLTTVRHLNAFMYAIEHGVIAARNHFEFDTPASLPIDSSATIKAINDCHGLNIPTAGLGTTLDPISSLAHAPLARNTDGACERFLLNNQRESEPTGAHIDAIA